MKRLVRIQKKDGKFESVTLFNMGRQYVVHRDLTSDAYYAVTHIRTMRLIKRFFALDTAREAFHKLETLRPWETVDQLRGYDGLINEVYEAVTGEKPTRTLYVQ